MRFARLLIVDSSIRTTLGHHFEYARSVAEVARRHGIPVEVAVHRSVDPVVQATLSARPAFRLSLYDHIFKRATSSALVKRLDGIFWILTFLRDWRTSGLSRSTGPDVLVFVPTAVEMTAFGLFLWLRWRPKGKRPKTAALFRFEARRTMRLVKRIVRPLVEEGTLMLATDSEVLARQYREITGLDFTVLPIPHITDLRTAAPAISSGRPGGLRFLFPGGARDEKGMDVLADALPILEDALAKKRILVTIQCNVHHYEERTDRALRQLEALQKRFPGAVHLVTSSLSSEEYYRMLAEADVILLPYRRGDYAARTSGIFAEALAAGKPVIVTTGTWMSAQLDHHGAGIGISDGAPQELAAAILRMEREHPAFASKALAGVSSWIAVHNDEQLLRSLLSYFGADA